VLRWPVRENESPQFSNPRKSFFQPLTSSTASPCTLISKYKLQSPLHFSILIFMELADSRIMECENNC